MSGRATSGAGRLGPRGVDREQHEPGGLEACLSQFPSGVFRALAQNRVAVLRGSVGRASTAAGPGVGGTVSPAFGTRVSEAPASVSGTPATGDATLPPGAVFRSAGNAKERQQGHLVLPLPVVGSGRKKAVKVVARRKRAMTEE